MTIRNNTDLGASFERLKNALKESNEIQQTGGTDGLVDAYAKLYVNVEYFVNEFKDPETISDIPETFHQSPKAN